MPNSATYSPYESEITGVRVLEELECLGIPFICYGDGARLTRMSAAARALLEGVEASGDLLAEVGSAVAIELGSPTACIGRGMFPLVRELPALGLGGVAAIRRPLHPSRDMRALVVLGCGSNRETDAVATRLTPRESQVAHLIARGAPNKQVAVRLGISAHTVRHHAEKVFEKLGVRSRASLACLLAERR